MLRRRDLENMRQHYQNMIEVRQISTDPTVATFYSVSRPDSGAGTAAYLDDAAYDPFADDQGYTESATGVAIPCALVPRVTTLRMTDLGYEEASDLEIEISARDIDDHQAGLDDFAHKFEYVHIDAPDTVDIQGRPMTVRTQRWYITSVRPLTVGRDLFGARIGLSLEEQDISQIGQAGR